MVRKLNKKMSTKTQFMMSISFKITFRNVQLLRTILHTIFTCCLGKRKLCFCCLKIFTDISKTKLWDRGVYHYYSPGFYSNLTSSDYLLFLHMKCKHVELVLQKWWWWRCEKHCRVMNITQTRCFFQKDLDKLITCFNKGHYVVTIRVLCWKFT